MALFPKLSHYKFFCSAMVLENQIKNFFSKNKSFLGLTQALKLKNTRKSSVLAFVKCEYLPTLMTLLGQKC